jgi:GNT-I family
MAGAPDTIYSPCSPAQNEWKGTAGGASLNQFGSLLNQIWLNPTPVNWTALQSSLLESLGADAFATQYWPLVKDSVAVSTPREALERARSANVRLEYHSIDQYKVLARELRLMDDEKANIPRTAYNGIVESRPHGDDHFIFLSPPLSDLTKSFSHVDAKEQS